MSASTPHPQAPPAHVQMFQLLTGLYIAGAIGTLAQLRVPDLLEHGPRSASELAQEIKADRDALYRLMRATASVGVLSEGPDGKFSQTPLSAVLRTNANPSLRGLAAIQSTEWHCMGWANLEYCVRTGKQALDKVYGMPIFKYFEQHPDLASVFNEAMSNLSSIDGPAVVDAYSFEGINSIVDVAGGHGFLLSLILARYPKMTGTLYEAPSVIAGAKSGPLKPMLDRCTFSSGDMFSSVPSGADAYIMKHIIHDWPDDLCIRILEACRKGVNAKGKLLVVDNVIQPGNDFAPGKFLDVQMLIFPGGRERSEKQFRDLFAASGWRLSRIIPTAAPESIVEGVPA
jgi:O-methyltransferase domain/Dimerisation domain